MPKADQYYWQNEDYDDDDQDEVDETVDEEEPCDDVSSAPQVPARSSKTVDDAVQWLRAVAPEYNLSNLTEAQILAKFQATKQRLAALTTEYGDIRERFASNPNIVFAQPLAGDGVAPFRITVLESDDDAEDAEPAVTTQPHQSVTLDVAHPAAYPNFLSVTVNATSDEAPVARVAKRACAMSMFAMEAMFLTRVLNYIVAAFSTATLSDAIHAWSDMNEGEVVMKVAKPVLVVAPVPRPPPTVPVVARRISAPRQKNPVAESAVRKQRDAARALEDLMTDTSDPREQQRRGALTFDAFVTLITDIKEKERERLSFGNRPHLRVLPEQVSMLSSVTSLDLSRCNLETIPPLGEMRLQRVSLANNHLTVWPNALLSETMKGLKVVNLSNNKIRFVPAEVQCLVCLEQLLLEYNNIRLIRCDFALLQNLEVLEVTDNDLRIIPPSLGVLSKLRRLKIGGNPLVNVPPDAAVGGLNAIMEYLRSGRSTAVPHSALLSELKPYTAENLDHCDGAFRSVDGALAPVLAVIVQARLPRLRPSQLFADDDDCVVVDLPCDAITASAFAWCGVQDGLKAKFLFV
jgi:hypothetical protein